MRSSQTIDEIWKSGFYAGDNRPNTRVTVEPDWYLNVTGQTYGASNAGPYRWFQRESNDQTEIEMPNIKSVQWDRTVDQSVATCNIEMYNQRMVNVDGATPEEPLPEVLGDPGYYLAEHGVSPEAQALWGHQTNEWEGVLVPNALIRTYQGYGGHDKTIAEAVEDGNLLITGVWLIDTVSSGNDGLLHISLRDVGKLLTDQQLYPPLIPKNRYPARFCRWRMIHRRINNRERVEDEVNVTPVVSGAAPMPVEADPQAAGYWELRNNGQVFGFGDARRRKLNATTPNTAAPNYGGAASNVNAIAINALPPDGDGYWVLHSDGKMLAYGQAEWYGDLRNQDINARDFAPTPTGLGYWILQQNGTVRAFGDAVHHGNATVTGSNYAQSIESHPTDDGGYWIMREEGEVTAHGSFSTYSINPLLGGGTPSGTAPYGIDLQRDEYFTRIRRTSTGDGYWLVSGSGKVRAFGDANHYGEDQHADTRRWAANLYWDIIPYWGNDQGYGLPGSFDDFHQFGPNWEHFGSIEEEVQWIRKDGNYQDYADIVKRLLRWSGWVLYSPTPAGNEPAPVFGSIESTGAYSSECLPEEMFDKKPVIDAITQIKELVGYLFYINEEGAAQFKTPNWWSPGNFDENGQPVDLIPDMNEVINVTGYNATSNDVDLRSEIIIATEDPVDGLLQGGSATRFRPFSADLLRGMVKPAMWTNGIFQTAEEQITMAELIALHIWFSKRTGQITVAANPNIQIDDQVRVYERVSSDTFIHYVRGQSMSHDLESGQFTMTLTTHWLGDQEDWSLDTLGEIVREIPEPCPPSSLKKVTYNRTGQHSSSDVLYGNNGAVHGHRPTNAFDVNPHSYWLSEGHADKDEFVWIEMDCDEQEINQIYVRPYEGNYICYASVWENGRWVRGRDIPGDGESIPYVAKFGLPVTKIAKGDGVPGWKWHMLPRVYKPTKIRLTITNLYNTQWGPNHYRAGVVTLQAANCPHPRKGGVAHEGYRGPQSNAVNREGIPDRQILLSPGTVEAVKKFGGGRTRNF